MEKAHSFFCKWACIITDLYSYTTSADTRMILYGVKWAVRWAVSVHIRRFAAARICHRCENRRSVQMTRWWRVRYTIAYTALPPQLEHANGDPKRIIRKSRRFFPCILRRLLRCDTDTSADPQGVGFFLFHHPASDHSPIAQLCPFNSVQKVKNASKRRNLPGKILQCTGGWAIIFQ